MISPVLSMHTTIKPGANDSESCREITSVSPSYQELPKGCEELVDPKSKLSLSFSISCALSDCYTSLVINFSASQ